MSKTVFICPISPSSKSHIEPEGGFRDPQIQILILKIPNKTNYVSHIWVQTISLQLLILVLTPHKASVRNNQMQVIKEDTNV